MRSKFSSPARIGRNLAFDQSHIRDLTCGFNVFPNLLRAQNRQCFDPRQVSSQSATRASPSGTCSMTASRRTSRRCLADTVWAMRGMCEASCASASRRPCPYGHNCRIRVGICRSPSRKSETAATSRKRRDSALFRGKPTLRQGCALSQVIFRTGTTPAARHWKAPGLPINHTWRALPCPPAARSVAARPCLQPSEDRRSHGASVKGIALAAVEIAAGRRRDPRHR